MKEIDLALINRTLQVDVRKEPVPRRGKDEPALILRTSVYQVGDRNVYPLLDTGLSIAVLLGADRRFLLSKPFSATSESGVLAPSIRIDPETSQREDLGSGVSAWYWPIKRER